MVLQPNSYVLRAIHEVELDIMPHTIEANTAHSSTQMHAVQWSTPPESVMIVQAGQSGTPPMS